MRILLTGGGCEEPIDGVRSVCNFSTGHTASYIAQILSQHLCGTGSDITLLAGLRAEVPPSEACITVKRFTSCADLQALLKAECASGYDMIIHAAAVSDYTPETVHVGGTTFRAGSVGKIPSDADFSVTFAHNPKLLDSLKKQNKTPCFLVAFKLTNGASYAEQREAVQKLYARFIGENSIFAPDVVVANDKTRIHGDNHECVCIRANGEERHIETLHELALYFAEISTHIMEENQ